MIAVDTNVLVGAIQTFDPQLHATARRAVKVLYRQGEQLACFPQNLVEFCGQFKVLQAAEVMNIEAAYHNRMIPLIRHAALPL
jgi:predicted nucleic acid-binding protein